MKRKRFSGASVVPIRIGIDTLLAPDLSNCNRRTVGQFLFALHHFDRFNEYFVYLPRMGLKTLEVDCDLPYWKISKAFVPIKPVWFRKFIHQSAFRFVSERDDLDVVHTLTPISPFATFRSDLENLPPTIVTVWDEPPLSRWLENSLQQATRIVTTSRYLAHRLNEQFGIPMGKIKVMPVGIDPLFLPSVNERNLPNDRRSVVVLGKESQWIKDALRKIKVNWLMIPTNPTAQQLKDFLLKADTVVIAEGDGCSRYILHALTMHKFIVAIRNDLLSEILGDAVIWIDEANPNALQSALDRAWGDKSWREQVITKANLIIQSRQWSQAIKAWVGLYRRVFENAVTEFTGWDNL